MMLCTWKLMYIYIFPLSEERYQRSYGQPMHQRICLEVGFSVVALFALFLH